MSKSRFYQPLISLASLVALTLSACTSPNDVWKKDMEAGKAAFAAGDFVSAEKSFFDAQEIARDFPHHDKRVPESMVALANCYKVRNALPKAEVLYAKTLDLSEVAFGVNSKEVAEVCQGLGETYLMERQFAQAEPLLKRALSIDSEEFGARDARVGKLHFDLGEVYKSTFKPGKAEAEYLTALPIVREASPPMYDDEANILNSLCDIYQMTEEFDKLENAKMSLDGVRNRQARNVLHNVNEAIHSTPLH